MNNIFLRPDILVLVLAFSVPLVAIIGYYWHETVKNRDNNRLKQSMLDEGMSAEDIEKIMNAGTKLSGKK